MMIGPTRQAHIRWSSQWQDGEVCCGDRNCGISVGHFMPSGLGDPDDPPVFQPGVQPVEFKPGFSARRRGEVVQLTKRAERLWKVAHNHGRTWESFDAMHPSRGVFRGLTTGASRNTIARGGIPSGPIVPAPCRFRCPVCGRISLVTPMDDAPQR
jgi:hypothetical protein